MQWLTTIKGLSRSGSGAHLALRRGRAVRREIADLAALLAGEGIIVRSIDCTVNDLPAALLGAELHAGASPDVIVIDHNHLVVGPSVAEEEEEDLIWDAPKSGNATLKPSTFVSPTPTWLPQLRNIYLWRIPEYGAVAASQVPFVSGCIGPLQHDPNWCRKILDGILASEATTHNPVCTRTLMGRLDDPRDGRPIARVAGVMSGQTGLALAEACAIVASSFVEGHRAPPVLGPDFDPRFLVCEPEAHLLLGRASQLSSNGARVLAWGPPGGGKSSFARALALGMANGRTVSVVTPSAILARPWGATERLIRAMWRRAASEGEVLVADEFEVICGVREGGAGNGYLIRCLTDEWLRALDDYPDVPLVATVNDVHAVDNAAVRRFVFVLEFKDTLTPHQEGLAWDIILRCSPPTGWQPCGAAIADLALAKHRCRMLGLADAASLSTAVLRARDARLGKSGKSRTTKAPRSSLN